MKVLIRLVVFVYFTTNFSTILSRISRAEKLCNDTTVSDEKMTKYFDAIKNCSDDYHKRLATPNECDNESDYVNDQLNNPLFKVPISRVCSNKYLKCLQWKNISVHHEELGQYEIYDVSINR